MVVQLVDESVFGLCFTTICLEYCDDFFMRNSLPTIALCGTDFDCRVKFEPLEDIFNGRRIGDSVKHRLASLFWGHVVHRFVLLIVVAHDSRFASIGDLAHSLDWQLGSDGTGAA